MNDLDTAIQQARDAYDLAMYEADADIRAFGYVVSEAADREATLDALIAAHVAKEVAIVREQFYISHT